MSEWQPIETAPKDGSPILIYVPESESASVPGYINAAVIQVAHWHTGYGEPQWIEFHGEQFESYEPTHWMPLPADPA